MEHHQQDHYSRSQPTNFSNCDSKTLKFQLTLEMLSRSFILILSVLGFAVAFHSHIATKFQISKTNLYDVPLELSGQLDPSKMWDVTLEFKGVSKVVSISEGSSILDIAESIFDGVDFFQ